MEAQVNKYTHVYPINDLREHETENGLFCWCHPQQDEGVIIHNNLDNREKYETGELTIN